MCFYNLNINFSLVPKTGDFDKNQETGRMHQKTGYSGKNGRVGMSDIIAKVCLYKTLGKTMIQLQIVGGQIKREN